MDSLIINDPIFGDYTITEPVLIELINTKAMQRLAKINQLGAPKELYYGEYSRLEHSLGVLIFLDMFNASLEEKIVGLLHDINHMAFSHVYDVAFGSTEEESQDASFINFINNNDEIKDILQKYNFEINKLFDFNKYTLLEKSSPDICADRIEYCLREYYYAFPNKEFVKEILDNLKIVNNEFIFKNKMSARTFSEAFLWLYVNHWNNPINIEKSWLFGETLKRAIKIKLITHDDFYKDDKYILKELYSSTDETIIKNIEMLKNSTLPITNRYKKLRYVDPKYLDENGKIVRLKETDLDYREKLESAVSNHPSYK